MPIDIPAEQSPAQLTGVARMLVRAGHLDHQTAQSLSELALQRGARFITTAMTGTGVFTPMVLQMTAIGEESGSLDHMLGKAAEFYEDEVDEMVKGLSSLMEPFIIVFLGTIIGGIVIAMYLPIFKIGQVV